MSVGFSIEATELRRFIKLSTVFEVPPLSLIGTTRGERCPLAIQRPRKAETKTVVWSLESLPFIAGAP